MSSWEQVAAAKREKKHELHLSGSEISQEIQRSGLDPNLFDLTELNFLNIHETCLNVIPDDISKLVNMQTLVLYGNKLETVSKNIGLLSKLKVLDLSGNCLKMVPEEIGNLSQLATLNLSSNCLETFPENLKTTKLSVLDLTNNKLKDFSSVCNAELTILADLKLNGNEIEEIPAAINVLSALKNFEISSNKIKSVPGELIDCRKLKEVNLKGNPISDKRLLKLIDQCRTKQVLDYVKQHCARTQGSAGQTKTGGKGGGKKGNRQRNEDSAGDAEKEVEQLCHKISVLFAELTTPNVRISEEVKAVRPHIVCCIVTDVKFDETSFKKFIQVQTKLHDTICEKRHAATIATHDLTKLKAAGDLTYTAKLPKELAICPLGRSKNYTGAQLYSQLQTEAENLRKEKKRNVYSGIHKYLYLLDGKPKYPCLLNSENKVVSFPPITNSEDTKITLETTSMFLEVTSANSQGVCKKTMDLLLKEILLLGLCGRADAGNGDEDNSKSPKYILSARQVKIVDFEGNMKSVYPSRTDLIYDGDNSIVIVRE